MPLNMPQQSPGLSNMSPEEIRQLKDYLQQQGRAPLAQPPVPQAPNPAGYNVLQSDDRPPANDGGALSAALQKGPVNMTPPQGRSYATATPSTPAGQATIVGQSNDPPNQRELFETMKQYANRGQAGYADIFTGDRQGEAQRAAENAAAMQANAAQMANIPHFLSGQSQMLGAGAAMTGAQAEAQKLGLMNNPRWLALQTEQKRLEQGLPPSSENELILRGDSFGTALGGQPARAGAAGPPAANPPPGGPPNPGGALSNAIVSTQDRLAQLPSGRQVINLGDKARANGGFPAFMQGVQGELGDQWIEQNFPLMEQYANERFPGELAGFVNPSRLGQIGQGIGSAINSIAGQGAGAATYRPDIPLMELLHRGGAPEDILRAKLRDKLQRMGKWNANTGAFSPAPYQP